MGTSSLDESLKSIPTQRVVLPNLTTGVCLLHWHPARNISSGGRSDARCKNEIYDGTVVDASLVDKGNVRRSNDELCLGLPQEADSSPNAACHSNTCAPRSVR